MSYIKVWDAQVKKIFSKYLWQFRNTELFSLLLELAMGKETWIKFSQSSNRFDFSLRETSVWKGARRFRKEPCCSNYHFCLVSYIPQPFTLIYCALIESVEDCGNITYQRCGCTCLSEGVSVHASIHVCVPMCKSCLLHRTAWNYCCENETQLHIQPWPAK